MASKRTFDEDDHQNNDDRDLQIRPKRRQQAETMNLSSVDLTALELLLRRVMEEVLPPMLLRYVSPCCRSCSCLNQQGGTSGGRAMQLCFVNGLPQIIFTLAYLTAEDGGQLQIELRDAASQQRVVTEEVSTMKVQICVLDGDFDNEDWTAEEFNAQIVKPRERKGDPLLKGDTDIKLENGVASINKNMIEFTDNSSWTRSKKFRLGAKIEESNSVGADIREGRTESFRVLDKRGEQYKKHERPSLTDNVCYLKNIRDGSPLHKQLLEVGIKTVKDLLRFNTTGSLREKFGNKYKWDTIIAHAKRCELDNDERYIYPYHATEQLPPVSLVFNCIYEVVEVMFYGQPCPSLQSLNLKEKGLVERVKQEAYNNLKNLVPIETQTHDIMMKLTQEASSYSAPDQGLQQLFLPPQQGQLVIRPALTPIIDEFANNGLVGSDQVRGEAPLNLCARAQVFPLEAYMSSNIDDGTGWIDQFGSYQWDQHQLDPYSFPCGDGASCSINHPFFPNTAEEYIPSIGKSKTVWHKIRNALKWVRKAKLFRRQY